MIYMAFADFLVSIKYTMVGYFWRIKSQTVREQLRP